jgi:hypothetical protein
MRSALVWVGILGCGKSKPELPANIPYAFEIAFVDAGGQYVTEHPASGGRLYRNGKPLATVDSTTDHRDRVTFTVPATELPSTWGTLELVLGTPCGERRIPMDGKWKAGEGERDWVAAQVNLGHGTAELTLSTPASAVRSKQTIRVEWGRAKDTLAIGKLSIAPGVSPVVVIDPTCATDIPLRLGNAQFGKLGTGDAFILADPGACYSVDYIGYGSMAGDAHVVVKTPYYGTGDIDYFLTPPADSASVAKGVAGTVKISVQAATCPPPGSERNGQAR